MSGAIAATSAALGISAAAATGVVAAATVVAASAAYQTKTALDAEQAQDEALEKQNRIQSEALTQAQADQTTAQQNINKANQARPSVAGIIEGTRAGAKGGAAGTMLTGPYGVSNEQLSLGKSTLLGG